MRVQGTCYSFRPQPRHLPLTSRNRGALICSLAHTGRSAQRRTRSNEAKGPGFGRPSQAEAGSAENLRSQMRKRPIQTTRATSGPCRTAERSGIPKRTWRSRQPGPQCSPCASAHRRDDNHEPIRCRHFTRDEPSASGPAESPIHGADYRGCSNGSGPRVCPASTLSALAGTAEPA